MTRGRADRVKSYFDAYLTGRRDVIEAALADDFTFTSPYDDAIDRAAYFERCWPGHGLFKSIEVERACEDGDAVLVVCRCEMKNGKSFRNMEFHRFEGDWLKSVEVFFGSSYRDGRFVAQRPPG
jgi:ketosteroid isomerase-like protein